MATESGNASLEYKPVWPMCDRADELFFRLDKIESGM